jgi:flagellar biosynthesis anti-sigma factor FlgM
MRIIDSYGKINEPAIQTTKQGAIAGQAPHAHKHGKTPPQVSGEKVTVSAQAQELADKAAADAETAKVDKLRAAIQDGTFKPNPQVIAKRIVEGG